MGDDYETVACDAASVAWSIRFGEGACILPIEVDPRIHQVTVSTEAFARPTDAVQEGISRVLLEGGLLPLHAALVTPRADLPGLLLVGESSRGKSSLAWLAVSNGWRVVSDDHLVLRSCESAGPTGATFRKRLRIAAHLVDATTESLGHRIQTQAGLRKVRLDPDAARPGSFLRAARIGRIAFLERASARCFLPLSRTEALERLMSVCSPALTQASTRAPFQLLADLVRCADAKVARLTQACLSDPRVLEELSS